MLSALILTLIWTFNLSALALGYRGDLLKRVVFWSWELIVLLTIVELGWTAWALVTDQPPVVCATSVWLGVNLLITVSLARERGAVLAEGQLVLLCSWWLGLLAMMGRAVVLAGVSWV